MSDLTGYTWRPVGPAHPHAAELVPVDDWRVHDRGPDCPCGPTVSLAPTAGGLSRAATVTETWTHTRTELPDTIEEMDA